MHLQEIRVVCVVLMTISDTTEAQPAPPANLIFGEVRLQFVQLVAGDVSRGFAPFYHFRILVNGTVDVGHINLRIGETVHVRRCAGHLGFEIFEAYRGRGYAFKACKAIAPFVLWFYDSVIVTCDPDNEPSRQTLERLGAAFLDEVPVPEHEPAFARGSRTKRRYQWNP